MADSGGSGGQGGNPMGHNPFKLGTGPPSSTSLVFPSANPSHTSTQPSDPPSYMLFGGQTNAAKTSNTSAKNLFGMTSAPSTSTSSLFRPRMSISSSIGQGDSVGINTGTSFSSSAKPDFGGVTNTFSSGTSSIPSSNVFGGLSSSPSMNQSIFSAQTQPFPSNGNSTALLFGNKTSTSVPSKTFGDSLASAPSNDISKSNSGKKTVNPFSTKSDALIFPKSSNVTDFKPAQTPLLFGGATTTSYNQVSAPQNVFGGTSAPKLFQGMKDTSIKGADQCDLGNVLKSSKPPPEKVEKIFGCETLPEKNPEELDLPHKLFDKPEPSETGSSPPFDKKEITKIIIAQIPDSCMDKEILKNHFIKYGNIKRVTMNPKANQAVVQYEDHHSASKAKKKGKKLHPKLPEVKIFYGSPARRRSEDEAAIQSKKRAIRTLQQAQIPSDLEPYVPISRPPKEAVEVPKVVPPKTSVLKRSQGGGEKKPEKKKKQPVRGGATGKETKEQSSVSEGKEPKEILQQKCNSSQDRYSVLQARDNLVRKELIRTSDIKKATYLAATCPDMCPEKERYMRDVQYDLSSYEMKNGVIDHSIVIKKFSRSSADKDEPLPYELRPGPVLMKTMDFLVCNIIERGDDEGVEMEIWYNYLWNRTRAIRNDLMQQQLTDALAVNIIQRCMRFHIHAGARFCHEPPDLFDAKMNTEHLTKSLQTLKELYKDLGERGEFFDTEPEFRAYELLLNLNQGETLMTQYSQYRDEVQKSKEVQFALKVGMAVMFNNYVKFFKLIRSATYLQACMMHRYFRQVRLKALDTLMKAYVPPKQIQALPLETVIRTLGFEDEVDAEAYLLNYGIRVAEKNVIFDKSLFTPRSEELPPVVRPVRLIESNRNCSVGEVVQAGPLPENPLDTYVPHNSFDNQGYLKQASINASDQQTGKELSTVETREPEIQQPQRVSSQEVTAFLFNLIRTSVCKEMISHVCKEAKEECRVETLQGAKIATDEMLEKFLKDEIRCISKRAVQEIAYEEEEKKRRQMEEERKSKALQELTNKATQLLYREYLEEYIDKSVRELCCEAVQIIEKETWEAVVKELLHKVPSMLFGEVISSEIQKLCTVVFNECRDELEAKIFALQKRISTRKMEEYFKRWRLQVVRVKRRKQAQETFPASCSQLSVKEQNELFGWGYQRNKEEYISAFRLSALETSISKNIEEMTVRNQLVKACAWHSLPLQEEMKKEVDGALKPVNLIQQYVKILICTLEKTNSVIIEWLRSKLSVNGESDKHQKLDSLFHFISKSAGLEYACLLSEVSLNNMTAEDTKGISALIFVMPLHARKQELNNHVLCLLKSVSNIPKLTIQYDEESCDAQVEGILNSPTWKLAECDLYYPETSRKLLSHILELWKQQNERMQIVSYSLNNYVYGFIAKKVIETFLYKNRERVEDGKSPLHPEAYIGLYNEAINHLIRVVKDEELRKLEWPTPRMSHLEQVPPMSWNSSHVDMVSELLKQLQLPKLNLEDFVTHGTLRKSLHEYAIKISNQDNSSIVLISHLDVLLMNTLLTLDPTFATEDGDNRNWNIHVLQWPWTELIKACIYHKLTGLPDLAVYYQPRKLTSFKYPHSWWEACDAFDLRWEETGKNSQHNSRKRKPSQPPNTMVSQKKKPSQLLTDIAKEKSKSMEFERKLQNMLDID